MPNYGSFKRSNSARELDRKQFAVLVLAYLKWKQDGKEQITIKDLTKKEQQVILRAQQASKFLLDRHSKKRYKLQQLNHYQPHAKAILALLEKMMPNDED